MLNQGVDGNDKESTCKTECSQKERHLKKGQSMEGNGQRNHRHANGAKRDEAVLNLSRRKQAGGVAPDADANGQRRLQIATACLVKVQDFTAVENNNELQQRAEKPEVSIAGNGQVQDPVWPDELDLFLQVTKYIETECPGRVSVRHPR